MAEHDAVVPVDEIWIELKGAIEFGQTVLGSVLPEQDPSEGCAGVRQIAIEFDRLLRERQSAIDDRLLLEPSSDRVARRGVDPSREVGLRQALERRRVARVGGGRLLVKRARCGDRLAPLLTLK